MRGKKAPKRSIAPDPKFQRIDIAKLINYVMSDGKKTTAQRVVYNAFVNLSFKTQTAKPNLSDLFHFNIFS